jgi:hypothetical protein
VIAETVKIIVTTTAQLEHASGLRSARARARAAAPSR